MARCLCEYCFWSRSYDPIESDGTGSDRRLQTFFDPKGPDGVMKSLTRLTYRYAVKFLKEMTETQEWVFGIGFTHDDGFIDRIGASLALYEVKPEAGRLRALGYIGVKQWYVECVSPTVKLLKPGAKQCKALISKDKEERVSPSEICMKANRCDASDWDELIDGWETFGTYPSPAPVEWSDGLGDADPFW